MSTSCKCSAPYGHDVAAEAEHKVPRGSVGEPKAALQHLDDALQRQRGLARGQHRRRRLDQRVVDARVEETLRGGVSST